MKQTILFLLLALTLFAQEPDISVTYISGQESYSPGDTATFALIINIPEEYHLYANPKGPGVGKPLTLTVGESASIDWLSAKSEKPEKYIPVGLEDQWTWTWKERVIIFIQGVIRENGGIATNDITVDGLICKTACIPVRHELELTVEISESPSDEIPFAGNDDIRIVFENAVVFPLEGAQPSTIAATEIPVIPMSQETAALGALRQEGTQVEMLEKELTEPHWTYSPKESSKELNLGLAIFFAFLAGIILNFMPCVLPVLGIKILSFSKGRQGSKATAIGHSLAFAAGMVLIFLVLATLAAFLGMSWGEQFQDPVFIVILVSLIFLFGLGMFDLFIILVPSKVSEMDMKQDSSGYMGNFLKGMFATVLATPCSGPLLGATLAWTLTQSHVVIYTIFLALGVGMAFPYVLLAASDRLSRMIPKPGAWMEDFKHILGFFLFGFAVYLMIGLPRDWILPTVGLLVALAAGVMAYLRIAPFGTSMTKKIIGAIVALLLIYGGYHLSFKVMYGLTSEAKAQYAEEQGTVHWIPFSNELLQQAHNSGQDVIVDFTANWCMNCQFNKINVFHTKEMERLIKEKNILPLKADLTTDNPTAEKLRNHLGSRSIPFFAIFPADSWQEPVVMRDILDKKKVFAELQKLTNE